MELRALSKVAPYFERAVVDLYTGNGREDADTKELLLQVFGEIKYGGRGGRSLVLAV